jgi:hypothetical protein
VAASGVSARTVAGYLVGIAIGMMSITLLFLGMRAVLDVGGACADGGPYVSAQPCPAGVPLAMVAAMFGLFLAAGLILWFGSRIGGLAPAVVALGWPALFLALGYNFLDYAFNSPDSDGGPVWGWLIPGVLFVAVGLGPVVFAVWGWREARHGGTGRSTRLASRLTSARSTRDAAAVSAVILPTDPAARPTEPAFTSTAFAPAHAPGSAMSTDEEDDRSQQDRRTQSEAGR